MAIKDLMERERRFQQASRERELRCVEELEKHAFFRGVTIDDVKRLAHSEEDIVRTGFADVVGDSTFQSVHILSLNWSREYIRYVCSKSGNFQIPEANIHCDGLVCDSTGAQYSGYFDREVVTGLDKYHILDRQFVGRPKEKVWYVGDSENDLLCILHPEVIGILMYTGKKEKLNRLLCLLGADPEAIDEDWNYFKIRHGVWCVRDWLSFASLIKASTTSE
ncbi:HCL137Wp [Eremothecium sinecaudum]|uniref:HCL137Wp n=1 Tax=Eremothecium sinecaudum TaxID=45286 RepID=A0A0X8HRA8_9SACH|nr:HCL137Wp [Eremothecium sinecaudum]AMD20014.1 HCL137Wp [Eremothecium sinecaudum]